MERMGQMNHGAARQIFDSIDVPEQMKDFYNGIANPLIWNLKLTYSNAQGVGIRQGTKSCKIVLFSVLRTI